MLQFDFSNQSHERVPASLLRGKREQLAAHVAAPLGLHKRPCIAALALLEDDAIRTLNHDFRGKNKPTNVLSFPQLEPPALRVALRRNTRVPLGLGDILIALPYTRAEAMRLQKPLNHHLTHLVVHGLLHLLGFDHMNAPNAEAMETLETKLLAGLAIPDPYTAR